MKAFDQYRDLLDEHTVFFYSGAVTEGLVTAVSEAMNRDAAEPVVNLKRFYFVLVECLQNVIHHAGAPGGLEPFLVVRKEGSDLTLVTGNETESGQAHAMEKRISEINSMDPGDLRETYLGQLRDEGFTQKGGAGLGLLAMARKTRHPLGCRVTETKEDKSYMVLTVKI